MVMFDIFSRISVRESKMNVIGCAQLTIQTLTLQIYIHVCNSLPPVSNCLASVISGRHCELCDILTLSVTELENSFPTAQFHITDFVLHRKDRNVHDRGIITYIRSDSPHRLRYDMELNAGAVELIILKLYKKEKWFICSCFKPFNIKDSVLERNFSELSNSLQIKSPHILISEDIN